MYKFSWSLNCAAGFSEQRGFAFLFYFLIISALVVSAALFFVAPMIRRMMDSEAASTPPDKPENSEPELAKARLIKSGDA